MTTNEYDQRRKLVELADEEARAKLMWLRSYMEVGRFSTAYMREANILMDALEKARRQLKSEEAYDAVLRTLTEGTNEAAKVRLDSVMPDPLTGADLADQRKAFVWMAEKEGMDVTKGGSGNFFDRKTQKAWIGFQAGYRMAMQFRNTEAREKQPPCNAVDRKKFFA